MMLWMVLLFLMRRMVLVLVLGLLLKLKLRLSVGDLVCGMSMWKVVFLLMEVLKWMVLV